MATQKCLNRLFNYEISYTGGNIDVLFKWECKPSAYDFTEIPMFNGHFGKDSLSR